MPLNNNVHNSKQWSSETPGYILFLVDQSGSMSEPYPEKETKANFTALVINRTINELINTNAAGDKIKDRVFISIIGYGGKGGDSVDEIRSDILSQFAENPLRMEKSKKKINDGQGGLVEIDVTYPIFVEPVAKGTTPMGMALELAKGLIEDWLSENPNNPAPVVINISDGLPWHSTRKDAEKTKAIEEANAIMNLSCEDGNPLIFNAHIGDSYQKCICSTSKDELPDEQAKFLFDISSKIPESYKVSAKKLEINVQSESKGFVSNADPETFIKFINFGSSGGSSDKRA